jgi:hypothetical protein
VWSPETTERLADWTRHFVTQGADTYTAARRATAMLYHDTVAQAQVLAYVDEFFLLSTFFFAIVVVLPFMRRVRAEPASSSAETRLEGLPAAE